MYSHETISKKGCRALFMAERLTAMECCILASDFTFFVSLFQSVEAKKMTPINKIKERAQEAKVKAQLEEEEFSRQTQEKLRRSMEVNKENRDAQIQALQSRLRDHVSNIINTNVGWAVFLL